jgi:hypothetical protein
MTAVQVEERGNSIEVQLAQPLFQTAVARAVAPYDVSPDGKRFVVNTVANTNATLTLVVNWPARLVNKP